MIMTNFSQPQEIKFRSISAALVMRYSFLGFTFFSDLYPVYDLKARNLCS